MLSGFSCGWCSLLNSRQSVAILRGAWGGPCPSIFLAGLQLGSPSCVLNFTLKFVWLIYTADDFQPVILLRLSDNLQALQPAFNISQIYDKLCCYFWRPGNGSCWWRHNAWLLGSWVNFSQIAIVMAKDSVRSYETVAEMGRLSAFQSEVKLDYITVSRLLLVPVANCLWKHNTFGAVSPSEPLLHYFAPPYLASRLS